MIGAMKTTLSLRDDRVARAKTREVKESTTLSKGIEEGLPIRSSGKGRP